MTTHEVPYPFVRCTVHVLDEDGGGYISSWRPGIVYVEKAPGEAEGVATAMGKMILNVVDTHKPGRYPERTFYTREWETPDGKRFGDRGLRVCTTNKFNRLCSGFAHPFILDPEAADPAQAAAVYD